MKQKKPIVCCFCPVRPCLLVLILILIPILIIGIYASIYDAQYIYIVIASGCPASLCNEKIGNGSVGPTGKPNDLGQNYYGKLPATSDAVPEKNKFLVMNHYFEPIPSKTELTYVNNDSEKVDEKQHQEKSFLDRVALSLHEMSRYCSGIFRAIQTDSEDSTGNLKESSTQTEIITETVLSGQLVEDASQENTVLRKDLVNPLTGKPVGSKIISTPIRMPEHDKISPYDQFLKEEQVDYENLGFNIPNSGACKEKDLKMLVGIHSFPKSRAQRDAIRNTWAQIASPPFDGYKYVFIIGFVMGDAMNELKHESDEFGDIIQTSVLDRNDTLTMKSVLFLKWIKEECPSVRYVLKTNDDVFVNLPLLVHEMEEKKHEDRFMYGFLYRNYTPKQSKALIDSDHHQAAGSAVAKAEQTFPDFITTEGYVFPGHLAPVLYEAATQMPTSHYENVFVTGILAEKCNIKRIDIPFFSGKNPTDMPSESPCEVLGYADVIHPFTADGMRSFWKDLAEQPKPFECGNFNYYAMKMYPNSKLMYSSSLNNAKIHLQPAPGRKDVVAKDVTPVKK